MRIASLLSFQILFWMTFNLCAQDHAVRIAFVGNSITYGSGLSNPQTQSYPAQLADMLQDVYGDTCVVGNFAVSARTMLKEGDFPIWEETAFKDALRFRPHIVVIALGTNDSKPYNWDDHREEFFPDYLSMVDTFRQSNPYARFFACYPPPAYEVVWDIRDSVIVNGVIPAVDRILDSAGAELIDFYSPLVDSVDLFPDKIHPSEVGSAVMAGIAYERFMETGVIPETEQGLTFILDLVSDRRLITSKDTISTLSWKSVNAMTVSLDGEEVDLNGSHQVSHRNGYTHTVVATGEKRSDTLDYTFDLYQPELGKINLEASEKTFYTGDTISIMASFLDQHRYPMNDTVLPLSWTISIGEGWLSESVDNAVRLSTSHTGSIQVKASYEGRVSSVFLTVEQGTTSITAHREKDARLEIWPNPFTDHLRIRFKDGALQSTQVLITDLTGRICLQEEVHRAGSEEIYLNTSALPEGIYMYRIGTGDQEESGLLLKSGK